MPAQESGDDPPPEERTRIGVYSRTVSDADGTAKNRVVASASNILVASHPDALFVDLSGEPVISEEAIDFEYVRDAVFDLLLLITVAPGDEEQRYPVTLELYDVRGRNLLTDISAEIGVGRLGRYLRSGSWEAVVHELDPHIEAFRPFTSVTVRSEPEATITWSRGTAVADGDGRAVVRFRHMRSYTLTAERPGFRSREVTVFVGREGTEVDLTLLEYPRWFIGLGAPSISYPKLYGGAYLRETSTVIYAEVPSLAVAFTPLRQYNSAYDERPSLLTFFPITELALGVDWFLASRDRRSRPYLGGQLFGRFLHASYQTGIEPVLPGGAAVRLGLQRELGEQFFFDMSLDSRLYYLLRPSSTRTYDFHYTLFDLPILWNPATVSIGLSYAP